MGKIIELLGFKKNPYKVGKLYHCSNIKTTIKIISVNKDEVTYCYVTTYGRTCTVYVEYTEHWTYLYEANYKDYDKD